MLQVNLIGKSNGVGLDRDARLLAEVLRDCGCSVTLTITGSRQSGRRKSPLGKCLHAIRSLLPAPSPMYDLNVMLEHVWVHHLRLARYNVVIPNPDFFDRHDVGAVGEVDKVWCKTQEGARIFRSMNAPVTHIGFDSDDRWLPDIARRRTCLHLAGSSKLKGTERLLQAWALHPQWPELLVVGRLAFSPPTAANIRVIAGYVEDDKLRRMQNESLIHVCTSETEGWGHYLAEALSVGAAVITVAAPPMNELVTEQRGWLLPGRPAGHHQLAACYEFNSEALEETMNSLGVASDEELTMRGARARIWFLENKQGFHGRVVNALRELDLTG